MDQNILPVLLGMVPALMGVALFVLTLFQHQNQQNQNDIAMAEFLMHQQAEEQQPAGGRPRQARRFKRHPERRNHGHFNALWNGEEERFVEAFRMSKNTFGYILDQLRPHIEKMDIVGDTIPPETRLAVCLTRLVRGAYFYNIAELFGIGVTTAQNIYNEVIRVLHDVLFQRHVTGLLPSNADEMRGLQRFMDFPYAFAAIDGCHIRLQCPSTNIWEKLRAICYQATERIGQVDVPGLILADNAFPFRTFIMKRFSQANRTPDQAAFNKSLSKDRVIVENTFGWLKMRFRELFRGSESDPNNLKHAVLAAVVIHNILMEREEPPPAPQRDDEDPAVLLENVQVPDNHHMAEQVRRMIMPIVIG